MILNNLRPMNICRNSVNEYVDLQDSYRDLISNETCLDLYLNSDQLNIVGTIYDQAIEIWNTANCDDCYQQYDNGSLILADETNRFFNLSSTLNECFTSAIGRNICTHCLDKYRALGFFYLFLEETRKTTICFDMQDQMNQTRSNWSGLYGCQRAELLIRPFLIICAIIILAALTFYVSCYLLGNKSKGKYEILK